MKELTEGSILTAEKNIQYVKESSTPRAFIGDEDSLLIAIASDPISFYLATEEYSHFFTDNLAIPVRKNFEWREQFNKL
jgi:hypothetical protein